MKMMTPHDVCINHINLVNLAVPNKKIVHLGLVKLFSFLRLTNILMTVIFKKIPLVFHQPSMIICDFDRIYVYFCKL